MRRCYLLLLLAGLCMLTTACAPAPDYIFLITGESSSEVESTDETETDKAEDGTVTGTELVTTTEVETTVENETTTEKETTTEAVTTTDDETTTEEETTTQEETTVPPETTSPPDTAGDPDLTPEGTVVLVSLTDVVSRGNTATLSIRGKPGTEYVIEVFYATTVSTAKGLEPKVADGDGLVTWTWRVGSRTKPGTHRIVIKENGNTCLILSFTTTE